MNRRALMIGLHWITVLLVTVSFATAWGRAWIDDLDSRAFWLDFHRLIGLAILAATVVRLLIRSVEGPASSREQLHFLEWIASRANHFLIYALLVAMPLIGWAQSSAHARHFTIFGVRMPSFVGHDRDFAETLGWWHEQIAWLLLGAILLHALGALYHHYVRRDDVVRNMLPRARTRAPVEVERYDIAA